MPDSITTHLTFLDTTPAGGTTTRKAPARNRPPRDTYRSRLYEAEHAAGIVKWLTPEQAEKAHPELRTIEGCADYVRKVLARPAIRKDLDPAAVAYIEFYLRIENGAGRRGAWAYSDGATMGLPRWSRQPGVVLHELAHLLATRTYGFRRIAGHGREFVVIYRRLVRGMLGVEAERRLVAELKSRKVPTALKRQLSPEAAEAARQRGLALAAARKAAAEPAAPEPVIEHEPVVIRAVGPRPRRLVELPDRYRLGGLTPAAALDPVGFWLG